jgi:hypothetical protein
MYVGLSLQQTYAIHELREQVHEALCPNYLSGSVTFCPGVSIKAHSQLISILDILHRPVFFG